MPARDRSGGEAEVAPPPFPPPPLLARHRSLDRAETKSRSTKNTMAANKYLIKTLSKAILLLKIERQTMPVYSDILEIC